MKGLSISIIIIISLFGCETVAEQCEVFEVKTRCTTIEVPSEIYQSNGNLEINGFNGTSLPQYLFRYSRLQMVFIEECAIKIILENTFVDWSANKLTLKFDGIETIQPGAFKNLTKLDELVVSDNKLTLIQAGTFTKLPIRELKLSRNSITTIEDLALSDLPNIKKLSLSNNKIESIIISKIIDDPSALTYLDLESNSLKTLTNDMLKGLTNLGTLDVGFNKISTIEQGTFEQTPKLHMLYLSKNGIREIDMNIFPQGGFPSLKSIYLLRNELMYLPSDFFVKLNHLESIVLSGNPWLCTCLDAISEILRDKHITKGLAGYWTKRWGICLREPTETKCSYKYNRELIDSYLRSKNLVYEDLS